MPDKTILDDTSLVAWLLLKGHAVTPLRCVNNDQRLSFNIAGDTSSIEKDMNDFHNNVYVKVQDFNRSLKTVKSMIWNMRKVKIDN